MLKCSCPCCSGLHGGPTEMAYERRKTRINPVLKYNGVYVEHEGGGELRVLGPEFECGTGSASLPRSQLIYVCIYS